MTQAQVPGLSFKGRVAIVTGAGHSLGRAYAIHLAERGASVVVNDLGGAVDGSGCGSPQAADAVVAEILARGGRAVANYDSVAAPDGPAAMVAMALQHFGQLDIVINNAGIELGGPLEQMTPAAMRPFFDVHFWGVVAMCQAAWPALTQSGTGRIVNTTSAAIFGIPERSVYAAAKGAVFSFTRTLAIEAEAVGIKVNCIAPAAISRMVEASNTPEHVRQAMRDRKPPELVAPAVALLAHERCPVNGETISAGGERVSRISTWENPGFSQPGMRSEDILANWDQVVDLGSAVLIDRIRYPAAK